MTQVWDDQHRAIPVTVVRVSPARVVQVKTPEKEGYSAAPGHLGHAAPLDALQARARPLREGRASTPGSQARRAAPRRRHRLRGRPGDRASTSSSAGEQIDATAIAKGKGFAGGMKRHNFKGQGAAHGNHKHHRAPGLDRRLRDARTRLQGHEDGRAHGRRPGHDDEPRGRRGRRSSASSSWSRARCPGPRGGVVVLRTTREEPDGRRRRAMSEPRPCADRSRRSDPRPRSARCRAAASTGAVLGERRPRADDLRHRAQRRGPAPGDHGPARGEALRHPVDQDPRRGARRRRASPSARRAPATRARARPARRTTRAAASRSGPSPAATPSARPRR